MTAVAMASSSVFAVRVCDSRDESDLSALVHLWLESYRRSWFGKAQCPERSPEERRAFFQLERGRVLWHAARGEVTFAVDADAPEIIYGLACLTGDVVHYAMVKREIAREGFSRPLFEMLLGDRLTRQCAYTSEQNDLTATHMLPRYWYLDGGWYFRERERECKSSV